MKHTPPDRKEEYEGMYSPQIKQHVRRILLSGRKITAIQLNREADTNDARKIISDLRKEGMDIRDVRMDGGRKLYWLEHDNRVLSINFNDNDNERD